MTMADTMRDRLTQAFAPDVLTITDESESHRGHSGWQDGGESHFRVVIRAGAFAPMTRIERHRAVHAALGPAVTGRIHALALEISG
jgi:BolA family transcriptional regulator, general stress-responsive regulator